MNKGFSVVEILLAVVIFGMLVTVCVGALQYTNLSSFEGVQRSQALHLAQEGLEAARSIRNRDFTNFNTGNYGLGINNNRWEFVSSPDNTSIFTRNIEVSVVENDVKQVKSTVTWNNYLGISKNVTVTTLLTNWLKTVSGGTWNAVGNINLPGNNDALKVQLFGDYAYIIRSGGSPDFYIYNISNPASPTLIGSADLDGTLIDIAVSGNYAYVASDSNSAELIIANVTIPALPVVLSSLNLPGNANPGGLVIKNNTIYLTRQNSNQDEFYTINVSNNLSPSVLSSINLGTTATDVYVNGNYAYVGSSDSNGELKIVNVSNTSSITLSSSYNLSGSDSITAVTGYNSTVFASQSGSTDSVSILSVSNPTSPSVTSTYAAGDNINDLALNDPGTQLVLATEQPSNELKILNISNLASPSLLNEFNENGDINGVAISGITLVAVGAANNPEVNIYQLQ